MRLWQWEYEVSLVVGHVSSPYQNIVHDCHNHTSSHTHLSYHLPRLFLRVNWKPCNKYIIRKGWRNTVAVAKCAGTGGCFSRDSWSTVSDLQVCKRDVRGVYLVDVRKKQNVESSLKRIWNGAPLRYEFTDRVTLSCFVVKCYTLLGPNRGICINPSHTRT